MSQIDTIMAQSGWPALYRVFGDSATLTRSGGATQICPVILDRQFARDQIQGVHVTDQDASARLRWSDLTTPLSRGDTLTVNGVVWTVVRCMGDDSLTVTYLVRK